MFVSNLDPIALSLGPITFGWYGLLFTGGFIIGYFIMQHFFKVRGYNTQDLDKLLLMLFLGTVIGARLGHCLFYAPDYYLANPLQILMIWKGGLASHGGTVGVLLVLWLFCRKSHYSFVELADMISVPTALVCTMIRIGNFFNSEILGIPTNSDYGVVFARLGETFPRHPAQLYEAACYFIFFIALILLYHFYKKRPQGFIFGLFITLVFTSRFFIEYIKVEQADYSTDSILTVGQYLSMPFIAVGLLLILWAYIKNSKKGN